MARDLTDQKMVLPLILAGGMYLGIAFAYFIAVATPWYYENTAMGAWVASFQPLTVPQMFLATSGICLVLGLGVLYYAYSLNNPLDSSVRVDA